jgi:hypothetical protein
MKFPAYPREVGTTILLVPRRREPGEVVFVILFTREGQSLRAGLVIWSDLEQPHRTQYLSR